MTGSIRSFICLLPAFFLFVISADPPPPLAQPEQIHLSLAAESNAMTVTWLTMTELASSPTVEYGLSQNSLSLKSIGSQTDFLYKDVHRYIHSATLTGLNYNTTYYYQVGTAQQGWSHVFHFRTFPQGNNFPYRICIFGDLGYINGASLPYLQKAAQNGDFDLVIHVGDLAYDLHSKDGTRGDLFMNQIEPIAAYVPYMVIAGNHEEDGRNFSHYRNRFRMPHLPGGDNQYYSFDLGSVHFAAVSTEYYGFFYEYGIESIFSQYNWLKEDLKKANANRLTRPWIISYQHRPYYCSGKGTDDCTAFESQLVRSGYEGFPGLEEVMVDNGVDLTFTGHEHAYERFWPTGRQRVYNLTSNPYHNAAAPVYVVSGSAGCHSGIAHFHKPPSPGSAARFRDYGYSVLHVKNHTHLYMEQISVEMGSAVIDSVWITKDVGYVATPANAGNQPSVPFSIQYSKCPPENALCQRISNIQPER